MATTRGTAGGAAADHGTAVGRTAGAAPGGRGRAGTTPTGTTPTGTPPASTSADSTDAVLEAVGPRLRAPRSSRRMTLAEVATVTGISVSTLSRLESGQRRATLELLLPLARTYRVALDDLVGAPATGDPRIRLQPVVQHGMTMLPLSRRPGGLQAYKVLLPPPPSPAPEPDPRSHEGYDWMHVLSGRIRLVLGEHDLVLTPGETAEFDTRTPHWFANAGPGDAEVLALFGPQGERMHVRARTTRR